MFGRCDDGFKAGDQIHERQMPRKDAKTTPQYHETSKFNNFPKPLCSTLPKKLDIVLYVEHSRCVTRALELSPMLMELDARDLN